MHVFDILRQKGSEVVTITPERTVHEAVEVLVEHNIGAVVVVDREAPIGILSERDVLRLAARFVDLSPLCVRDHMTSQLIVRPPSDGLQAVMDLMTSSRIRHLPIVENGTLVGIVSIGDVVNALRRNVESENQHLRQYIRGSF